MLPIIDYALVSRALPASKCPRARGPAAFGHLNPHSVRGKSLELKQYRGVALILTSGEGANADPSLAEKYN